MARNRARASMREGPLAELFRATEAAQRQAEKQDKEEPGRARESRPEGEASVEALPFSEAAPVEPLPDPEPPPTGPEPIPDPLPDPQPQPGPPEPLPAAR